MLDQLLEAVAPTRCAGCDLPGSVFCAECMRSLPAVAARFACARCGAPFGYLTCTECWATEYSFEGAVAAGELAGQLARSVVLHKDGPERRLGHVFARLAFDALEQRGWAGWPEVVTWVPPTAKALRRRGFDHGHGIASPLAGLLRLPARPVLDRARASDQRALGREARSANASGTFRVKGRLTGRILLVDDVMTTGATAEAASAAMLDAGAEAVRVVVVARAW